MTLDEFSRMVRTFHTDTARAEKILRHYPSPCPEEATVLLCLVSSDSIKSSLWDRWFPHFAEVRQNTVCVGDLGRRSTRTAPPALPPGVFAPMTPIGEGIRSRIDSLLAEAGEKNGVQNTHLRYYRLCPTTAHGVMKGEPQAFYSPSEIKTGRVPLHFHDRLPNRDGMVIAGVWLTAEQIKASRRTRRKRACARLKNS